LVSGTLRDNLTLGSKVYSEADLSEACIASSLDVLLLQHKQEGLDLEIHEGGHGLSLGQAQLVHLARLFLSPADVWLLDEPTAALDVTTEAQVEANLQKAFTQNPDLTCVVATHKMSLLKSADRIIVMAGGRVVLDGARDMVLQKMGVVK
jgi:ATP-binding cassette subfamily C protein LapB